MMKLTVAGPGRWGSGLGSFFGIASMLLAAGLLTSCNGSSGGGVRVFFGSNGHGQCRTMLVTIDLNAIGGSLGDPADACDIAGVLQAAGCELLLTERDGVLEVGIVGCTIPPSSPLFDCAIGRADVLDIQRVTDGFCGCSETRRCDPDPPICVSGDSDRLACETCDNGLDDDGNGAIDCNDDNCRHVAPCATTTTTTTSTSSSSSTVIIPPSSTEPPTTSTTLGPPATDPFAVALNVASANGLIAAIQVAMDYSDAEGEFAQSDGAPSCVGKIPGALFSAADNKVEQTITIGVVSLEGFRAPATLAVCEFRPSEGAPEPKLEQFDLDIEDATDPDFNPVQVNVVPDVDPLVPIGSSTTTTTTTTLEVPPDPNQFLVIYDLESASDDVGALQLESDYSDAPGEFEGTAQFVSCRKGIRKSVVAFNDNDATEVLGLGFVSLNGFEAPRRLATCIFQTNGQTPVPGQFDVDVIDASNPEFQEIDVQVKVRIEDGDAE